VVPRDDVRDGLPYTLGIPQDVIVPKAQDRVSLRSEIGRPSFVGAQLAVLATVGLDDQRNLTADEVRDVGADGKLADELVAIQQSSAQD
jgi:hypothetical protein